jgi:hypothetical protein
MPRPYNRRNEAIEEPLIKVGPYQEVNSIPDLSIQEVEAIWRQCCPMPGFSQLDIHQFSNAIILKLREKTNVINNA